MKKPLISASFHLFFLIVILLLGAFLRFVNFSDRWGLAFDQAHSAVIARYALETFQLPLLGPFSSGGPFQTGGEWYWIVMFGTALYPSSVLSPWVFVTLLTVIAIFIMYLVGQKIFDSTFGLICAALLAVSTAQITQSTNLTNQTPIILTSVLSVLFSVLYINKQRISYIFFLAFFISLGSSIHIQSIALFPLLFFTLALSHKKIKGFLVVLIAGVIPWIPVLIADSQNNFYNTLSMISYFTSSQSQVPFEVLGRRWITFLFEFVPYMWSFISGGYLLFGYLIPILLLVIGLVQIVQRKVNRHVITIALSFFIMVGVLRYTRTPLFESFYVFIHPFVIILTGYVVYWLYKQKKIFGIFVLCTLLISSTIISVNNIVGLKNETAYQANQWVLQLENFFPQRTYALYDYSYENRSKSVPLVLFLMRDELINDKGIKIGVAVVTEGMKDDIDSTYPILTGVNGEDQLYNLDASESAALEDGNWISVNPSSIYSSTQAWYKKNN